VLTYGYDLFASMPQKRRPENKEFIKYVSRSLKFRQFNLHIKRSINKMKFMNSLKTEKKRQNTVARSKRVFAWECGGGFSERWYKET
jgi:hypothetical protein